MAPPGSPFAARLTGSKQPRSSVFIPSPEPARMDRIQFERIAWFRSRAMDVRSALKSQYHAALKTLHQVIEHSPDGMWNDPADSSAPFWRVAYHTLFFTHFYLQPTQEEFR